MRKPASHGWMKDYNHAERLLWQNADQILSDIGLQPGSTLVDIGSGDGFFSLPAARIIGPAGFVYALDNSAEAISRLENKADEEGLTNIRTFVSDAEKTILCEGCADIVLMANVLHDFDRPLSVLGNAQKTLKPGGIIADLDWKKEPQQLHGPPFSKRLNQEEASSILKQGGFEVFKSTLSGPFHYLLLARLL